MNRPRVVVVDDSALMLKLITAGLEAEGDIEVVAQAASTAEARDAIKTLNPDVVTLDVEMPGMDGLAFLKKIMELHPMPVIMVSSLTAAGADTTLSALQFGAFDAIAKPVGRDAVKVFGAGLRQMVHTAAEARVRRVSPVETAKSTEVCCAQMPVGRSGKNLIGIGASTGGVTAVHDLLAMTPTGAPPIVISQHMPVEFTGRFAARLNKELRHDVALARDGEPLRFGMVRIAPGDAHLQIKQVGGQYVTRIMPGELVSGHMPSVDVMFESIAKSVGRHAIGVILTGMGKDGANGLLAMRAAGALCLGQNERSCVVYGMPKAAMARGAVCEELSLNKIAGRICDFLKVSADTRIS